MKEVPGSASEGAAVRAPEPGPGEASDPVSTVAHREHLSHLLQEILDRAHTDRAPVAVFLIGVDALDLVIESLGHHEGDLLLTDLWNRVATTARDSDLLSRFGDGALLLVRTATPPDRAREIADRILEGARVPHEVAGHGAFSNLSVGIVVANGPASADAVLRNSSTAMHKARARGSTLPVVFEESMHHERLLLLETTFLLSRALERGELRVVYQPVMSIATGKPVGFEALARWEHAPRGLVDPVEFIPIAEGNGLIHPIGRWLLAQALRQIHEWRSAIPGGNALRISVNLSGAQLDDPALPDFVDQLLSDLGLDAECVELELTESAIMRDMDVAIPSLERLRASGIAIGIDDFGTGLSSLSYLHRLPVSTLKIDQSFIRGLGVDATGRAIITAIVDFAHTVSLRTVAEGVTAPVQLRELEALGVDLGQGFLWSAPLRPEEVPSWLEQFGSN